MNKTYYQTGGQPRNRPVSLQLEELADSVIKKLASVVGEEDRRRAIMAGLMSARLIEES